jgi:catechol 2,3-dioxygenase-like lactoylglutathione lyase family enzyme
MGITGIDHWVIVVGDVERTLDFYRRLGFEIASEPREGRPAMPTIRIGAAQKINVHAADWPDRPGYLGARRPSVGGADLCLVWDGTVQEVLDLLARNGIAVEAGWSAHLRARRLDQRLLPGLRRQPRRVHRVRADALIGVS